MNSLQSFCIMARGKRTKFLHEKASEKRSGMTRRKNGGDNDKAKETKTVKPRDKVGANNVKAQERGQKESKKILKQSRVATKELKMAKSTEQAASDEGTEAMAVARQKEDINKAVMEFDEDENHLVMEAEGNASFLHSDSDKGEESQLSQTQSSNNNATCMLVTDGEDEPNFEDGEVSDDDHELPTKLKKVQGNGQREMWKSPSFTEHEKEEMINEMLRCFQAQMAEGGQGGAAASNEDCVARG